MRRIGVISDVHGNLLALKAVLADAEREGCHEVWCLGDTFTGADAIACFDLVRERCKHVLFGNHEEMVLIAKTERHSFSQKAAPDSPIGLGKAQLDERPDLAAALADLRPLETIPALGGDIVLAHGSPHGPVWHWVKSAHDVELAFRAAPHAQLLLVGHTHAAAIAIDADGLGTPTSFLVGEAALADGYELDGRPALVNPGSVGDPPPGIRASWGILTLDEDGGPRRFDWRFLTPVSLEETRLPSETIFPLADALTALEDLSIGDALGERYFGHPEEANARITARTLPDGPWRWTDDTLMACSIVDALARDGELQAATLHASLARHVDLDRGYGPATRDFLLRSRVFASESASELFDGQGSYGNGAAARVAPLGAWHAYDGEAALVAAAECSATVTHTHAEGRAGAIAVAVAAALATRGRNDPAPSPAEFLAGVLELTPRSRVAEGLALARSLAPKASGALAAGVLGNGRDIAAHDTVPFALWAAACSLDNYEATFWRAVSGLGDRDTTCAIACAVVACRIGTSGIPVEWRARREPLPAWLPVSA
jgi:ADP-ribosylglycohydrolase/predicted phosphodiesterase